MSKKVIEPVIIEQSDGSKIEVKPYGKDLILVIQEERPINISNANRTIVAKAIDPEYQKVIDQNAKLVEIANDFKEFIQALIKENGLTVYSSAMRNKIDQALQNTKNIEG